MTPKKVLILGSYAPSLVNFRGPLIEAITSAGHEVVACAPAEPGWSSEEVVRLGARFRPVPLSRTGLNPIGDVATYRSLKRLFVRESPDLFLGYTAKPVIYGTLAAHTAGVPASFALVTGLGYAFTAGTELRRKLIRSLTARLYRAALARASAVFFQNTDDIADFRRLGILSPAQRTLRLNGSGVDLDRFAPEPLPNGPPTFLLIARLVRDKGIVEYVEAARILKPRWPQARFVLVGPFDDNPAGLKPHEIAAWQQEGLIEYAGEQKDVRPFLRDCTVYVLPSSYREGMPRTILEAMATGRAVITTDAPGCRDTVEPGRNGLLIPLHDAPALAAAMRSFLENPDQAVAMGAASRAMAEQRFDAVSIAAEMLQAMGLSHAGATSSAAESLRRNAPSHFAARATAVKTSR